jgi:hypothetical protein
VSLHRGDSQAASGGRRNVPLVPSLAAMGDDPRLWGMEVHGDGCDLWQHMLRELNRDFGLPYLERPSGSMSTGNW